MSIIVLLFFVLFLGVGVLGSIFWIWMLIDCIRNEPDTGNTKLIWVIVIVFTHVLGALVYALARRPERLAEAGR